MSAGPALRRLYNIPIIHTQQDLGSLAAPAQAQTTARLGSPAWQEKQRLGLKWWDRIADFATALPQRMAGFRLYQDGLPVCGTEEQIVRELATAGSRNHQLLLELVGRGAILMGTEAPQLLREEYQLAQHVLSGAPGPLPAEPRTLLGRRDAFIALRIAQTLKPGETGVLFIGALHNISPLLPADIEILRPLQAPAGPPG